MAGEVQFWSMWLEEEDMSESERKRRSERNSRVLLVVILDL
jgi:hypothetical protein